MWSYSDPTDWYSYDLFDSPDIVLGILGELFEPLTRSDVFSPSLVSFVYDLNIMKNIEISRHTLKDYSVVLVSYSNLDFWDSS